MKVLSHGNLEMGIIFFLQTGAGILGNSSPLSLYHHFARWTKDET
jgi:hypothetical protein